MRRHASIACALALVALLLIVPAAFATPPPNDGFADATELVDQDYGTALPAAVYGTNAEATKEPSEPDHAGNSGGGSVWYRWTAPFTGRVAIDLCGSSFDTLLAVYQGDSVEAAALTEVTSNDDALVCQSGGTLLSSVSFTATEGEVYRVAIDGRSGSFGDYILRLRRPPELYRAARVGLDLVAWAGDWPASRPGQSAPTYQYLWQRCSAGGGGCVNLGEASPVYPVQPDDEGMTLRYRVVVTYPDGGTHESSFLSAVVKSQHQLVYVSPGGSTTHPDCDQANPCEIHHALEEVAQESDEVIIGTGEYVLSTGISAPSALEPAAPSEEPTDRLTIHGDVGGPRPHLIGSGDQPVLSTGYGSSASHLHIESSGGGAALRATADSRFAAVPSDPFDRLLLEATGGGAGLEIAGGAGAAGAPSLQNTLVSASGVDAVAIEDLGPITVTHKGQTVTTGSGGDVTDVTAIATGAGSTAVKLDSGSIANTIARGAALDICCGTQTPLVVTGSNYRTDHISGQLGPGSGGNQHGDPLFVNAGTGDYHVSHGSPTIRTGTSVPDPAYVDLDGNPRPLGGGLDIGAYEFTAPIVTTAPVSAVTSTSATLNGTVNPDGSATAYRFEYSTDPAFSSSSYIPAAPVDVGSDNSAHPVSQPFAGLTSDTNYYFRIVAISAEGTSVGQTLSFFAEVPPTASITGGPAAGARTLHAVSFSFSSSSANADHFECRLDGQAFAPCTSPKAYSGLSGGTHSFRVRAVSLLGNPGPEVARSWNVDATPPSTTIRRGPRRRTPDRTPTFGFASSEAGSRFRCRIDRRPWFSCGSRFTSRKLKLGRHRFRVRAIDRVGNVDPTPARRRFRVVKRRRR